MCASRVKLHHHDYNIAMDCAKILHTLKPYVYIRANADSLYAHLAPIHTATGITKCECARLLLQKPCERVLYSVHIGSFGELCSAHSKKERAQSKMYLCAVQLSACVCTKRKTALTLRISWTNLYEAKTFNK